jgi:hypothetical protein
MMPLSQAQKLIQKEGQIEHIVISNHGGPESGAALTDEVIEKVQPTVTSLGRPLNRRSKRTCRRRTTPATPLAPSS